MTQRTYQLSSSRSSRRPSRFRRMSYWTCSRCFDCACPCTRRQPSTNSATESWQSPSRSRHAKRSSASYLAMPSSMNCCTIAGDFSASRNSSSSSSALPSTSMSSKSCLILRSISVRFSSSRRTSTAVSHRAMQKTFSTTTAVITLSIAKFMNIRNGTKKIHAYHASSITRRTMSGQSSSVMIWKSVKTELPTVPNHMPISPPRCPPPASLPRTFVMSTADT
mmetsp:Transcript_49983/g.159867  ORF Transcript_49983/g.159867 Transcript_49983/m.159867 type:complete len:222 (+) Transcript_49983:83-748(+)